MNRTFRKTLSANDVGSTGSHQAGMHVPKTAKDLLAFLPYLDPAVKNADSWIECVDEDGVSHEFRFVYYNNRHHDVGGTRDEYRITYMTGYFRRVHAKEGDVLSISRADGERRYQVRVERACAEQSDEATLRIKLKAGWQRVC